MRDGEQHSVSHSVSVTERKEFKLIPEDKEDIQQQAKLIALEKGKLDNVKYVAGIARQLKKGGRTKGRLKEYLTATGEIDIEDPRDIDLELDVARVVSKLTQEEKLVVHYYFIRGQSIQMLTGKLGRGYPYVSKVIANLKDKLREQLRELVE